MAVRSGVCMLVFVLALGSLACAPKPSGSSPFLVMIAGNIPKEGSFEDCVIQTMKGGKTINDAIKQCAKLVRPPEYAGTGLRFVDLLGAARIPGGFGGVTASDCHGDWNSNAPIEKSADFRAAQDAYLDYLSIWVQVNLLDGQPAKEREAAQLQKIAIEKYKLSEEAKRNFSDEEKVRFGAWKGEIGWVPKVSEPGDYPIPDPDGPAVARPIRDSENLCQKVAEFIGECNRDGWRNPDCKSFLDRLNKCLDRTVADPADPSESCSTPRVDPETVRDVVMLRCMSVRKPVPGEDPCSKRIDGQAFEYYFRTGGAGLDPCTDPHVRRTGEDCYPTFTIVKFGEIDLQELVKWGQDKFGGPIVVIPVPPPDPGDPLPRRPQGPAD